MSSKFDGNNPKSSSGGGSSGRSTRIPKDDKTGSSGNSTAPKQNIDSSSKKQPESSNARSENTGRDSANRSKLADGARNEKPSRGAGSQGGSRDKSNTNAKNAKQGDTSTKDNKRDKGNKDNKNDNDKGNKDNKNDKDNKNSKKDDKDKDKNNEKQGSGSKSDDKDSDKKDKGKDQDGSDKDSDDESKDGAKDKAKNASAGATGVDYSDKSTKDQLEHQAADVAMDATPGLGQANSARKKLKEYNKAKKDATGKDDGVTDKVEEAADDGIDKGIKAVKYGAVGAGAGATGTTAMAGLIMAKMLMMLKTMLMAVASKVAGFFSGIFTTISSFISGALGVAAAIGHTIAAGFMAVVVTGASIIGVTVVQEATKKVDPGVVCAPEQTSVSSASQEYVMDGDRQAMKKEYATKLWSVYSELGGSKEQTAAVLGNFEAESGVDPTGVETVYDEDYMIGPKKQAIIDADFLVDVAAPAYGAEYEAIKYMGIGLGQWTNSRNRMLIEFAEKKGVKWYKFDTQIAFMLSADAPGRVETLMEFIKAEPGNVEEEVLTFMTEWEGLPASESSLDERQAAAVEYMFILERATVDTEYAESILSGLNVNRSEGNSAAAAYHQDDGCGNPIISHYGNKAADGTGEVPAGLPLVPWSRETLPSSLSEFSKDPANAGLTWGNGSGWEDGGITMIADQCVAFATSYFMALYPDWNENGRSTTRPSGNGKYTAGGWAEHYGERVVYYPTAGAVFSNDDSSRYGHTGIVQHVFANGDILIAEQNVAGVSGAANNQSYSWSWRVIKKERYESDRWEFFKPAKAKPLWVSSK